MLDCLTENARACEIPRASPNCRTVRMIDDKTETRPGAKGATAETALVAVSAAHSTKDPQHE